ncbi:MAG: hypothetical protein M0015_04880 [Betaproteobacteria bacterium]|nr:hypothetical protein [Betaproteobacteria bacterium]
MCHLVLLLPLLALPVFWLLPPAVAVPLYAVALAIALATYVLALKTMRLPRLNGADGLIGRVGRVVRVDRRGVTLQVGGEYWGAETGGAAFELGEQALVTGMDRLRLEIARPADRHEAPGIASQPCHPINVKEARP